VDRARPRVPRRRAILIAEGSKSEPNYFAAVARLFGLTALEIPRDHRTDPEGLVREALANLKKESGLIALVTFDRDEHPNYAAALGLARGHPTYGDRLFVYPSNPCFELWLILHFEVVRAPLTRQQALAKLIRYVPDYAKGSARCMDELASQLDAALANAKIANKQAELDGTENPRTDIPELIAKMREFCV